MMDFFQPASRESSGQAAATFPANLPIDILGKPAEKIAYGDHIQWL